MSITQTVLLFAIFLSSIMVFLTYSPSDYGYFWTYWATLLTFAIFGYLIDILFSAQLTFVYDPNIENWSRKTNPQT